jgi:ABC-type cobalamin transport system permease subunit
MKDISVKELSDLAVAEVPEPESRVQRMFEWHFERDMTLAKGFLGAAASISVAVAVALFRNQVNVAWWWVLAVVASSAVCLIIGLVRFRQLRNIHKQFVDALKLHRELQQIAPFIRIYLRRRR